jgi:hypothetical protein
MNEFQIHLTEKLIELVSPQTLGDVTVKIRKGGDETTVEVILDEREVSFWVYVDGASILGRYVDARFEIEDYPDLNNLTKAFLHHVRAQL